MNGSSLDIVSIAAVSWTVMCIRNCVHMVVGTELRWWLRRPSSCVSKRYVLQNMHHCQQLLLQNTVVDKKGLWHSVFEIKWSWYLLRVGSSIYNVRMAHISIFLSVLKSIIFQALNQTFKSSWIAMVRWQMIIFLSVHFYGRRLIIPFYCLDYSPEEFEKGSGRGLKTIWVILQILLHRATSRACWPRWIYT